eukprot:6090688-Pyramimonas_sp.AAC.1
MLSMVLLSPASALRSRAWAWLRTTSGCTSGVRTRASASRCWAASASPSGIVARSCLRSSS